MGKSYTNDVFKIGMVSRMTGISTHTLRKWETRYGAVSPQRTPSGDRFYTTVDLERLSLIKRLVDYGNAPSEVATLSLADLRLKSDRFQEARYNPKAKRNGNFTVAIVGDAIHSIFTDSAAQSAALDIVVAVHDLAELQQTPTDKPIDVLIYYCPVVTNDTRDILRTARTHTCTTLVIVVYEFSNQANLSRLDANWIKTIRAPTTFGTLQTAIKDALSANSAAETFMDIHQKTAKPDNPTDVTRLSPSMIAKFSQAAPKVKCECPGHLADLIFSLRAFEKYSLACENDNQADEALHKFLGTTAAQACTLFENAIERVAEFEDINLTE